MSIINSPAISYNGVKNDGCLFRAQCFAKSGDACPGAQTSGGHIFCFGPETKIMMADHQEKRIDQVVPGDRVVSFVGKSSKSNEFTAALVKATAITEKQKVLKINDLRVTPRHKIILSTGRAIRAEQLKIGDKMLRMDGSTEEVQSIQEAPEPIRVYNLVLEKEADGYIANGLRVLSYPIPKGLEKWPLLVRFLLFLKG